MVSDDDGTLEKNNVLVLAGDTNVIKSSTNEDHTSNTFFKVGYFPVSRRFYNIELNLYFFFKSL